MTPLHTAVLWGHCQVVRVLLDNGANLKARTCWKPDDMSIICRSATPMQIACSERGPRHAIVRDMLQRHQEDMEHAVMMGQHPRLGFSSQLSRLDPELLRLIVESARMWDENSIHKHWNHSTLCVSKVMERSRGSECNTDSHGMCSGWSGSFCQ